MRVAIVRLSALGDIIHSALVLQYIKKSYPDSHITWFCDEMFSQVLASSPFIDKIVSLPIKRYIHDGCYFGLLEMARELKNLEAFDAVIDMQGLIKSAIITRLLGGVRFGFDFKSAREPMTSLFYDKKVRIGYGEHIFTRNMKLASFSLGFEFKNEDILRKLPFLAYSSEASQKADEILNGSKRAVLFLIGASKPTKRYPKEGFARLADMLDADIFLAYKGAESGLEAEFILQSSKNVKAALDLSLDELKALISRSKLVIGGDSGPTHIAWAMNVPSVTIFGNTPSRRFCPNSTVNRCLGGEDVLKSRSFDKDNYSINKIEPNAIADIAKELLG